MQEQIIVTGSNGQIGSELVERLRARYSADAVLALDIRSPRGSLSGPFLQADIMNRKELTAIFQEYQPSQVYHLAAILSATGELDPKKAWDLNMGGLLNVLECSREAKVKKLFWPSSIAVFGPSSPRTQTPQQTVMDPSTVYGISKLAGERWCAYYYRTYGLDIRSVRYPGIISWKTAPGGGTTDYAVEMYLEAIKNRPYACYLNRETLLPMMYMDDAIRATLEIMDAPASTIKVRDSYNISGMSFTPYEQVKAIHQIRPQFQVDYLAGDPRQDIADSWPQSLDDSAARQDWGWNPMYNLETMTIEMLIRLEEIQTYPRAGL